MRYICKDCGNEQESVNAECFFDEVIFGDTLEETEIGMTNLAYENVEYTCPECGAEVDITEIFSGEIYELSQKKGEVEEDEE